MYRALWMLLAVGFIVLPTASMSGDIDYKSKTPEELLQMCFEQNDSFACFMIAGKLEGTDMGRQRVGILEHGASVPGEKTPQSLYCMYYLAQSYFEGNGVPKDYVKAYKWANLLSSLPERYLFKDVAAGMRDELSAVMSELQIYKAQQLSSDWFENHPDW